jgi:CheY-like chemotaxis protein
VDTGDLCFNEIRNCLERFDIIILDTDLFGIDQIDLAKEILGLIPIHMLIITTAYDKHALTTEAKSIGISKEKVLLKPFRLSQLWSAVMEN